MNTEYNLFLNIRPIEGNQDNGFEELCCQLFHLEKELLQIPEGAEFFRVRGAGGDGGVESYWKLADGSEVGIQAKRFFSLDESKWQQVDKSVFKALESHPKLKKYVICFPIDLTDPHRTDQTSQRDKFEQHKAKWTQKATEKNMNIEFVFWGAHELLNIMIPKYEGLRYFWFNQTEITKNFLENNFSYFINSIGSERYKPDIHVKQESFDHFEYLGQTENFKELLIALNKELNEELRYVDYLISDKIIKDLPESALLKEYYYKLIECFEIVTEVENSNAFYSFNFDQLESFCGKIIPIIISIRNSLYQHQNTDELTEESKKKNEDLDYYQRKLSNAIYSVEEFYSSIKAQVNQQKVLFLKGEGGKGKTHLFASIVEERNKQKLVSLIFDGERIDANRNITQELIYHCGLHCNTNEFLGALDSMAQKSGYRGIIFIDALNEADNYTKWQKSLPGFISEVNRYPHLAIAFSYRTAYEKDVLQNEFISQNSSVIIEAPGFKDLDSIKLSKIFNKYEIDLVSVPTLNPEFFNPLFLILFCTCLQFKGIHQISDVVESYTNIFDFYLDYINDKISKDINIDSSDNTIQKACKEIAEKMATYKKPFIPKDEAVKIFKKYNDPIEYDKSLLKNLLASGIIHKHKFYEEENEVIRFSFERFSDHLIVKTILDKHFDIKQPKESFSEGSDLYYLINEYMRPGWLEALAIQLPEKTDGKMEIFDISDKKRGFGYYPFGEPFLDSLKWRKPELVTEHSISLLFKKFPYHKIYEVLINLAVKKNCPYNIKGLNKYLKGQKVFKRDSTWTDSLNILFSENEYGESIVKNIIHWVWNADLAYIDDELAIDYSVLICWFLTSSNRKLRDQSTRALVTLFSKKLNIVSKVLNIFEGVNDPYVTERLYCAAYGAVLIKKYDSKNFENIKIIAQATYDLIFKDENPPIHILLRDYARGIIEQADKLGVDLNYDKNKINPPYNSKFPKRFPGKKTIDKIYGEDLPYEDRPQLLSQVEYSVCGFAGDWGIYILKPKIGYISENKSKGKKAEALWDEFKSCLEAPKQQEAEKFYLYNFDFKEASKLIINLFGDEDSEEKEEILIPKYNNDEAEAFLDSLSKDQQKEFTKIFELYKKEEKEKSNFDTSRQKFIQTLSIKAQNWILKRVADLCDYKTLPKDYKDSAPYVGRKVPQIERLGKKYQWIALFEFLALATDKYNYCGPSYSDEATEYYSPVQISIRDIDPSLTKKDTKADRSSITRVYKDKISIYENDEDLKKWCMNKNVPDPKILIEQTVQSSVNFNLCAYYNWYTRHDTKNNYSLNSKFIDFYYFLKSYIVKKQDFDKAKEFFQDKIFFGRWMPEENEYFDIFHSEYPDSEVFQKEFSESYRWIKGNEVRGHDCPVSILRLVDDYRGSYSRDCSFENDSSSFLIPCPTLIKEMNLKHGGADGVYLNQNNEIVMFNPFTSAENTGGNSLLVKKDKFIDYLKSNEYEVFWTITGEKRLHFGKCDISGIYYLENEGLKGSLNFYDFEEFPKL